MLTRPYSGPSSATVAARAATESGSATSSGRSRRVDAVGAQFVGGVLAPVLVEFGDDDTVAVVADPAGHGQSEAAARAGDDDRACGRAGGQVSRG